MTDDEFKLIYNDACTTVESCNGRHTQRAINLLLQLVNALRQDLKEMRKDG